MTPRSTRRFLSRPAPSSRTAGLFAASGVDQLVEIALLAFGCFFLVDQRQTAIVKFLEELVPVQRLQTLFPAVPGKVKAKDPDISG